MSAQQGNGQKARCEQRYVCDFWIGRSRLGRLSIRFDGGPSYTEMIDALKEAVELHGPLVKRGDKISGSEWLRRIDQNDVRITKRHRRAIQTLMQKN